MNPPKQHAAELLGKGKLSLDQVAVRVKVSKRTISRWLADPVFQALIESVKALWREKARNAGIADPDWRQRNRNDRYKRLRNVIEERAHDPAMKKVPGGRSGLIVTTWKMQSLGEGAGSKAIPEYAVDTGMLKEMLELEEHAATEEGQWKQQVEHSGTVDINVLMANINAGRKRVADEKLARDAAEATKAAPAV